MRNPLRLALCLLPLAGWLQAQVPPPAPAATLPAAVPPTDAPVTSPAPVAVPPTDALVPPPAAAVPSAEDPLLAALLREALGQNPDVARSLALQAAEQERIPQARALPDPSLTLGLQNDGFQSIQVGRMETSYYQVMLTQPLPWPGKRGLRGDLASLGLSAARSQAERTRLSLVADLKRAYYGLLLVRGQLELLDQQAFFWGQASELTRVRYQAGQGAQVDLLRAQLEQTRLRQSRLALQSEQRIALASLNRLRNQPPAAPVPTGSRLAELAAPGAGAPVDWMARAEQESPELQAARIGARQAERGLDLARRERYPDLAVSAGLMPRGGLEPMWYAGVSVSLPLWSRQKQQRAIAEQEYRVRAQGSEAESLRNLLGQRIQERSAQLEAARDSLQLYQEGLLVQSEASFQANLAQYQAGRAPFVAVLESLNGWIADRGGYLQTLAQVWAVRIAQEEFNLGATPPISVQGLNAAAMGSGGSAGSGAAMPASPAAAGAASSSPGGETAAAKSM